MPKGSCLCGAVSFEVDGPLRPPDACHCTQCRKQSGHFWASTDVPRAALAVQGSENITWFKSSEQVRRGFCSTCGAQGRVDVGSMSGECRQEFGVLSFPVRLLDRRMALPQKRDE